MLFNSSQFLLFFAVVYVLYFSFRRLKAQNLLLLLASYVFYGAWNWRFLLLIWSSTLVDFFVGRSLGATDENEPNSRRKRILLLAISLIFNLGMLGFFKYYNFFDASFVKLLRTFGLNAQMHTLQLILPVGISFYTFQTLSYTIDIYRKQMQPTNSLLNFATFVAFFPQLVAGPIERAANFLPQIEKSRKITMAQVESGLALILFGLFKKVVIADNLGLFVNQIFGDYASYAGLDVVLAGVAFAFQIYGDFSGYSDIARGISRLMGFELILNFSLPFFALDPAEFWQRWHISLSTWFRDYIFFPLRRSFLTRFRAHHNLFADLFVLMVPVMVMMVLSGLWHGARWNFVIWGVYHGGLLIVYQLFDKYIAPRLGWRRQTDRVLLALPQMALMFALGIVGWIIFRAETTEQISFMLGAISFVPSADSLAFFQQIFFFIFPLLLIEVIQYMKNDLLYILKLPLVVRATAFGLMVVWLVIFRSGEVNEFIYFQF